MSKRVRHPTSGIHSAPYLREAGLLGGRPWWRSRLGVCAGLLAAALVVECIVYGWHVALWARLPMLSVPGMGDDVREAAGRPLAAGVLVSQVLTVVALLLPLWLTAKAWSRDLDPSTIDQMRVLPIDVDSFISARFIWMQVFFAACIASFLLHLFIHALGGLLETDRSILWFLRETPLGRIEDEVRWSIMPPTWFGFIGLGGVVWFTRLLSFVLAMSWALGAFGWAAFWAPRVGPLMAFGAAALATVGLPLARRIVEIAAGPGARGVIPWFNLLFLLCWILGCLVFLPMAVQKHTRGFRAPERPRSAGLPLTEWGLHR